MNKIKRIWDIIQSTPNGNGLSGLVPELRRRGFSMPEIRMALLALKQIRVRHLARGGSLSVPTYSHTIQGRRTNPDAQARIAQALGLPVEEVFPREDAA